MWLEIVLFVLGIPAGVIATYIFERWRHVSDDRELWVDVSSTSLKAQQTGVSKLEYRYSGQSLADPHLTTVWLWSTGKHDIPAEAFSGSEPLVLDLKVPVIERLEGDIERDLEGLPVAIQPSGRVAFGPGLVRKRFAVQYRLLTDGQPNLEIYARIVDLDHLRTLDDEWSGLPRTRVVKRVVGGLLLLALVVSIVLLAALHPPMMSDIRWAVPLITFGWTALIMGAGGLFLTSSNPSRRAWRAAGIRRSV